MFGCWIFAAGVAHLLSRLFSGNGSFGATIATLFALLHDLTDSFLGAIGLLDLRWSEVQLNSPTIWRAILLTLYSIALIMLFVLLTRGVIASQRIKRGPAILIGLVAFVVYQGTFFIFNSCAPNHPVVFLIAGTTFERQNMADYQHALWSILTIFAYYVKLGSRSALIEKIKFFTKEVLSHVSLFKQNNLCYVSASVLHRIYDFQLIKIRATGALA
jgi:hypothetical protein